MTKKTKAVVVKKKTGPKHRPLIERIQRPITFDMIFEIARHGITDVELARIFAVSKETIEQWKKESPEFLSALQSGKDFSDSLIEQSLYQRALGYTFNSEKIVTLSGGPGNPSEVVRVPISEHVPPDVTAQIFWLKNRKRNDWRDRISVSIEEFEGFKATVIAALAVLPEEHRSAVIAAIKINAGA